MLPLSAPIISKGGKGAAGLIFLRVEIQALAMEWFEKTHTGLNSSKYHVPTKYRPPNITKPIYQFVLYQVGYPALYKLNVGMVEKLWLSLYQTVDAKKRQICSPDLLITISRHVIYTKLQIIGKTSIIKRSKSPQFWNNQLALYKMC